MKNVKRILFAVVLWLPLSFGNAADKPVVYTVNYPLQYFAQRIAADHAEVVFPAPPDVDPAFWKPDTATIGAYQQADLVLLNGAGYAKWVEKVSLPRRRQVDTSASFRDGYIKVQDGMTHSHGPGGEHSHAGTAFTTWLDLYQGVRQAQSIMHALVREWPEHRALFEQNFNALREDLMALDLEFQRLAAGGRQPPLLASHPVYQYLARRYSLRVEAVQWEPEVPPDEAEWQRLRHVTERFPAQWMLWEKQPALETRRRLEALGISTLVFNPCANQPEQGDFLEVMQHNVRNLSRVYPQSQPD